MKPEEIETASFAIIDREAGDHDFDGPHWSIVRRMIHTTADFEFKEIVRFHPQAMAAGIAAIRSGKMIITDTNMARVGIRGNGLAQFGGSVKCYINDPLIHEKAKSNGITRAKVAVDMALSDMQDGIYVVGNAPTALLRLIELIGGGQSPSGADCRIAGGICKGGGIQSRTNGNGLSVYFERRAQRRIKPCGQCC